MRLPKGYVGTFVDSWQAMWESARDTIFCDDEAPALGKTNVYVCQTCGHQIITRHIDEGVTPFMISCRRCKGQAYSLFYRAGADSSPIVHAVWKKEPNKWWGNSEQQAEHASKGGVFLYWLRPINQLVRVSEVPTE